MGAPEDRPDHAQSGARATRAESERGEALCRGLQLLGLCGFAIAQPLLDLLGRNPEFFVARGARPPEIAAFAAAVLVGPAAAIWGCEQALALVSSRAARGLHALAVFLLLAIFALPLCDRLLQLALPGCESDGNAWAVWVFVFSLAFGALATRQIAGREGLRRFLTLLGFAPIVFAVLFFNPSIRSLMRAPDGSGAQPSTPRLASTPPIVLLIFDELSLVSLLDATDRIDAVRYPAFARLAGQANWWPRATSVHWHTLEAVPAILTGRYPGAKRTLATAREHPKNLFRLLGDRYRMNVVEDHTMLFESAVDVRLAASDEAHAALRTAISDVTLIQLHLLLPRALRSRLPSIDDTWKGFVPRQPRQSGEPGLEAGELDLAEGTDRDRRLLEERLQPTSEPSARFREFVAAIGGTPLAGNADLDSRPGFHFFHSMLPHAPWRHLASGRTFAPHRTIRGKDFRWKTEPWWVIEAQQRHLLQLAFVDRLLGELLERLDRVGLYDQALLIVTSDHGVAFWPGEAYRDWVRTTHPEDVLSVPLFIKRPFQKRGRVRDRLAETVDILPSVVDVLDVQEPWLMDGCSLFDESCERQKTITAWSPIDRYSNQRLEFDPEILRQSPGLARKLSLFGSGVSPGALYRVGPYGDLVGREAASVGVSGRANGKVVLERPTADRQMASTGRLDAARVNGVLRLRGAGSATPYVAIAVEGIIRGVVPAPRIKPGGSRLLIANLPETALLESPSPSIDFYLVSGRPGHAKLARLESSRAAGRLVPGS